MLGPDRWPTGASRAPISFASAPLLPFGTCRIGAVPHRLGPQAPPLEQDAVPGGHRNYLRGKGLVLEEGSFVHTDQPSDPGRLQRLVVYQVIFANYVQRQLSYFHGSASVSRGYQSDQSPSPP